MFDILFSAGCMLLAVRFGKFLEAQDSDLGNIPVNFFPLYSNLQLRTANDTQLMTQIPHICSISILRKGLRLKDRRSGKLCHLYICVFSSPEPKASVVVVRPSVVRLFTFSNIFSSETARPIKAKFYLEPPWEGGTKVCIIGPGHMTKMAATPIYGKNLKKSSSPEPAGRFPRNLVCSIGDSCPS